MKNTREFMFDYDLMEHVFIKPNLFIEVQLLMMV